MNDGQRDLTALIAIAQMVAEIEAAAIPTTEADRRSAERAALLMRSFTEGGAIRPRIRAMTRAEALAELEALRVRRPSLHVAHRDLTDVSDDDVRSALEDALSVLDPHDR